MLVINKVVCIIFFRKALIDFGFMLKSSSIQVVCYACIKNSFVPIGEDIDVIVIIHWRGDSRSSRE